MQSTILTKILVPTLLAAASLQAHGAVLFMDNFNAADTANFDAAPLTGRLSGIAAGEASLQAFSVQQQISGGALRMVATQQAMGGVRFGGENSRYNWAGATTGASILAAGGISVTFDWSYTGNSSDSWVALKMGTGNSSDFVNVGSIDHALLLRQNGGNERFDNGANTGFSGTTFNTSTGTNTHQVVLNYYFSSFDDGSTVNVVATVDGVQVVTDSFQWDGNGGAIYMDLAADDKGLHFVDNLTISTVPEAGSAVLGLLGAGSLLLKRRRR